MLEMVKERRGCEREMGLGRVGEEGEERGGGREGEDEKGRG